MLAPVVRDVFDLGLRHDLENPDTTRSIAGRKGLRCAAFLGAPQGGLADCFWARAVWGWGGYIAAASIAPSLIQVRYLAPRRQGVRRIRWSDCESHVSGLEGLTGTIRSSSVWIDPPDARPPLIPKASGQRNAKSEVPSGV